MSVLHLAALFGLAAILFMLKLIVANEYATWAAALARFLIRCSGLICSSYRDQWQADLRYDQLEGNSGLLQAGSCLLSAPFLAITSKRRRRVRRRRRGERDTIKHSLWILETGWIEGLGLSPRTSTILRAGGITTVIQLLGKKEDELLSIPEFDLAALNEVKERLVSGGRVSVAEPDP
jgi:Bacterial RNA polymerase, alpha chain C terminal domain